MGKAHPFHSAPDEDVYKRQRQQGVEQGRFAYTGVAAEGAKPPADPLPDLVQPFPAVVADGNEGQSGSFIGTAQELDVYKRQG